LAGFAPDHAFRALKAGKLAILMEPEPVPPIDGGGVEGFPDSLPFPAVAIPAHGQILTDDPEASFRRRREVFDPLPIPAADGWCDDAQILAIELCEESVRAPRRGLATADQHQDTSLGISGRQMQDLQGRVGRPPAVLIGLQDTGREWFP